MFQTSITKKTAIYFNEVVFPSILGLTSPMAFPQHSPLPCPKHLPYKVPSFSYLLSTLLSISSWAYLLLHYHLPTVSQFSLTNTTHLSSQHGQTISACFVMTSAMSSIASMLLTHSLLFLSLKLTPVIYLNILTSLLCIFLISSIFVGHVSLPYNIAGLMHVV